MWGDTTRLFRQEISVKNYKNLRTEILPVYSAIATATSVMNHAQKLINWLMYFCESSSKDRAET